MCHSQRENFFNRKGETFDWDNDNLEDLQAVNEQPKLVHPDIISEIPGVETADMYDGIIGPTPIEQEKPLSYAECAAKACINAGLDTGDQARGVIRKQDEVITIEDDDDDVVPGVFVDEDPIDAFSLSGEENFP